MTEYEELILGMQDFIKEEQLDEVSVKSLFQSSIEFIEPEAKAANLLSINSGDLSGGQSIKLKNVKISVRFALNTIFSVKPMLTLKGLNFILALLKAMLQIISEMSISVGRDEATVIFALYRLRTANSEEIEQYLKDLKKNGSMIDVTDEIDVNKALKNLLNIKSIEIVDGKYILAETVWVRR